MSGVVNSGSGGVANFLKDPIGNTWAATKNDLIKTPTNLRDSVTDFAKGNTNLSTALGNFSKAPFGTQGSNSAFDQLGLLGKPIPNIASQDPAAARAQSMAARDAAARQEQIDTLKGKPGRGGTILTDTYQYKV